MAPTLHVVCGDDEFAVKQRAKQLHAQWTAELGGMDHEIIDGTASNSGEALRILGRLNEALQTLPFFGGAKVVWLQNCNFLGDERTASAQAVTEALNALAQSLKTFQWGAVRLLISAAKIDKRKTFYKTLDKIGQVESFAALSADDKDWAEQAEAAVRRALQQRQKQISEEALAEMVNNVGPNMRLLHAEAEKLSLYVGERTRIDRGDVEAIVTANKSARAFALGEALGDRDLPRLLRALDEELWQMKVDSQKSEIGLLYGLITKIRVLIFMKEMIQAGWVKAEVDFSRFKLQLEKIPADRLPEDKRFSPLALNPYVLYKSLPQARRYSQAELIAAMELLLECNMKLISSSLDETLVLQQTLIRIVSRPAEAAAAR